MFKKIIALPTNTKILLGILGIMVIAGGIWLTGAAQKSDYVVNRGNKATVQNFKDQMRCEEAVKRRYTVNTSAYNSAMRECR